MPNSNSLEWAKAVSAHAARRLRSGLIVVCLAIPVIPAHAEYHLQVGDVVEISVARVPELQRRVPVQLDGSISFPLLGILSVAGLSLSEVQAQIKATIASKVFRQRTADGRENPIVIDPDEIIAIVAEYRPIYVNGDVSKPGEHPYRPLMTVRQAVALSGGYEVMRVKMANPILEAADLRSEYQSLWTEFAKEQAHVWRVKSELGDSKDSLDQRVALESPLAPSGMSEILRLETEHLTVSQTDYKRERTFLQHALDQTVEHIGVLAEQEQKEGQGAQADVAELQKVVDLFGKGTLPSPRVTDARRAVLLSSTRKLQTAAQLMQTKKQRDELFRQLERLDDQRRINLLRELQDANVKLSEVRTKLQSVGEKLQYTAMMRSQIAGTDHNKPEITVLRKADNGWERLAADEESELRPGDVVEVVLRYQHIYEEPAH